MDSHLDKIEKQSTFYREEALKKMAILLDELGQKAYHRLVTTRENYRNTVPKRYQLLNNVKIASKFDAGEALGGEFFDLVYNKNNTITFLISRTATYRLSTFIIELYQKYKESGLENLTHLKSFFKDVAREIEELDLPENKDLVHLMLFNYNAEEKVIEGYAVGRHSIIFSSGVVFDGNDSDIAELDFDNFYFKNEINDVEKFVISSSGLIDNFSEIDPSQNVVSLVKKSLNFDTFDFLEEIFFNLRKDHRNFLSYDSSLVAFEVL